jgi:hypothetical protein
MKWACQNGINTTIRTAAFYQASTSTIVVPDPFHFGFVFATPTLYLGAKHHRIDTFSYLLELGARIEELVKPRTCRAFITKLCQPKNHIRYWSPFYALVASLSSARSCATLCSMGVLEPHHNNPKPTDLPKTETVRMLLRTQPCQPEDRGRSHLTSLGSHLVASIGLLRPSYRARR